MQEERLGRRDQDVRAALRSIAALALRRVARADADAKVRTETGERAAQVALDVVVERLERRDVQQPQPLARGLAVSRSIPYRNAASVFPEPVGAWISDVPPVAIAGQPSRCAGVGALRTRPRTRPASRA